VKIPEWVLIFYIFRLSAPGIKGGPIGCYSLLIGSCHDLCRLLEDAAVPAAAIGKVSVPPAGAVDEDEAAMADIHPHQEFQNSKRCLLVQQGKRKNKHILHVVKSLEKICKNCLERVRFFFMFFC